MSDIQDFFAWVTKERRVTLKGDLPGHEFHGNQWTGGGGSDSGGGETVGNYTLSQDNTYIRHDAQAKKDAPHLHKVDSKIPEHLQRYIKDEDQKLSQKLQEMDIEKSKYGFATPEADKIFGQQHYLSGLEPEKIAGRATKLNKLIKTGKPMAAKFPGTGAISGRSIKIGDKIVYSSGTGAEHADVVDKYRPSK